MEGSVSCLDSEIGSDGSHRVYEQMGEGGGATGSCGPQRPRSLILITPFQHQLILCSDDHSQLMEE